MLIQVGEAIGVWWTIALLVADAVLGSLLARSQGRATWRRFNEALRAGRAAGARGARRRAGAVRRRAAADARLPHGHPRPAACCCRRRARWCARVLVRRFAGRMVAVDDGAARGARAGRAAAAAGLRRRGHGGRRRRPTGSTPDARRRRDRRRARAGRGRRPGPAFADAVTFAFGDAGAQLYGLARIGLSPGEDGGPSGSALARAVRGARAGRGARARRARGRPTTPAGTSIALGGLRDDGRRAAARVDGRDGRRAPRLRPALRGARPARRVAATTPVARPAGWPATSSCAASPARCAPAGARARSAASASAGTAGASRTGAGIEAARTIAAWPEAGSGVALSARAARRARAHADEPVWAALLDDGGHASRVDDPRLSTTYDADGRQRRAGLELWVDDDELPAARLGRGALRLDARPRRSCGSTARSSAGGSTGASGVGRYDVLRARGRRPRGASSRSRAGPSSRARGTRPRAPRSAPRTATAARTRAPAPRRRPR